MLSCHNTDERSETIDINCIPPETSGCDPVSSKNRFSFGLTCAEQSAKNFCKKMMKFHVLNYTFLALSIFVGKCNIWSLHIFFNTHILFLWKRCTLAEIILQLTSVPSRCQGERNLKGFAEGFATKQSRISRSLTDDQSWELRWGRWWGIFIQIRPVTTKLWPFESAPLTILGNLVTRRRYVQLTGQEFRDPW